MRHSKLNVVCVNNVTLLTPNAIASSTVRHRCELSFVTQIPVYIINHVVIYFTKSVLGQVTIVNIHFFRYKKVDIL